MFDSLIKLILFSACSWRMGQIMQLQKFKLFRSQSLGPSASPGHTPLQVKLVLSKKYIVGEKSSVNTIFSKIWVSDCVQKKMVFTLNLDSRKYHENIFKKISPAQTFLYLVTNLARATVPVLTSGKDEKCVQSQYTHFCCQMRQTQHLHYI